MVKSHLESPTEWGGKHSSEKVNWSTLGRSLQAKIDQPTMLLYDPTVVGKLEEPQWRGYDVSARRKFHLAYKQYLRDLEQVNLCGHKIAPKSLFLLLQPKVVNLIARHLLKEEHRIPADRPAHGLELAVLEDYVFCKGDYESSEAIRPEQAIEQLREITLDLTPPHAADRVYVFLEKGNHKQ